MLYARARDVDIMEGCPDITQVCVEDMPKLLAADCKSLFDHMCVEGQVPGDRHTAIHAAALRQAVSAGPGRDLLRIGMMWVAS